MRLLRDRSAEVTTSTTSKCSTGAPETTGSVGCVSDSRFIANRAFAAHAWEEVSEDMGAGTVGGTETTTVVTGTGTVGGAEVVEVTGAGTVGRAEAVVEITGAGTVGRAEAVVEVTGAGTVRTAGGGTVERTEGAIGRMVGAVVVEAGARTEGPP